MNEEEREKISEFLILKEFRIKEKIYKEVGYKEISIIALYILFFFILATNTLNDIGVIFYSGVNMLLILYIIQKSNKNKKRSRIQAIIIAMQYLLEPKIIIRKEQCYAFSRKINAKIEKSFIIQT